MDFELTSQQDELIDAIGRFARHELDYDVAELDAAQAFPVDAWRKCAAFGIQGLPVPEEYGGSGADTLTIALALEALGRACRDNGLLFAIHAHLWACQHPLLRFGSEAQKRAYLPGLADGSLIAAHGMSEPDSGSDAFAMASKATKQPDGSYRLNGSKTFVSNAPVADVFLVFARTGGSAEFPRLTAFLLERGDAGLWVGPAMRKMGLRTAPMAELAFDDCVLAPERVLGAPGAGARIFTEAMGRERGLILASAVGVMQRQVDETVAYARSREQYGQPIGRFQAVSHRIVDMRLRLETARLLLYRLAWRMDQGGDHAADSALVKLHVSEALLQTSLDALQIHGGYGYMEQPGIERDVRDAVGARLYSGTSDIMRNIVAREMGL